MAVCPEILEDAHFLQEHRVAHVQIRPRGIEPRLDPQRATALSRPVEALLELSPHEEVDDPTLEARELFRNRREGRHPRDVTTCRRPARP